LGLLVLVAILVVGITSRNAVMIWSSLLLLGAEMVGAVGFIKLLGTHGVPAGIVLLIMVVLLPLVEQDLEPKKLFAVLMRREGLVALGIGAVATYLGGLGVELMQGSPEVVVGIVVGTTLGTVFFRGIPTGPLVAAGAVALALRLLL
jgi:uncharacterized membrane protein (DUF441 family)